MCNTIECNSYTGGFLWKINLSRMRILTYMTANKCHTHSDSRLKQAKIILTNGKMWSIGTVFMRFSSLQISVKYRQTIGRGSVNPLLLINLLSESKWQKDFPILNGQLK